MLLVPKRELLILTYRTANAKSTPDIPIPIATATVIRVRTEIRDPRVQTTPTSVITDQLVLDETLTETRTGMGIVVVALIARVTPGAIAIETGTGRDRTLPDMVGLQGGMTRRDGVMTRSQIIMIE